MANLAAQRGLVAQELVQGPSPDRPPQRELQVAVDRRRQASRGLGRQTSVADGVGRRQRQPQADLVSRQHLLPRDRDRLLAEVNALDPKPRDAGPKRVAPRRQLGVEGVVGVEQAAVSGGDMNRLEQARAVEGRDPVQEGVTKLELLEGEHLEADGVEARPERAPPRPDQGVNAPVDPDQSPLVVSDVGHEDLLAESGVLEVGREALGVDLQRALERHGLDQATEAPDPVDSGSEEREILALEVAVGGPVQETPLVTADTNALQHGGPP